MKKAHVAIAPFQVVAVESIKAGIKAARPVAAVLRPMAEKVFESTIKPVLVNAKNAVLGAAFDEYVADLEKANPAFSLVRKMVRRKK